jgi:hypothetical protein
MKCAIFLPLFIIHSLNKQDFNICPRGLRFLPQFPCVLKLFILYIAVHSSTALNEHQTPFIQFQNTGRKCERVCNTVTNGSTDLTNNRVPLSNYYYILSKSFVLFYLPCSFSSAIFLFQTY